MPTNLTVARTRGRVTAEDLKAFEKRISALGADGVEEIILGDLEDLDDDDIRHDDLPREIPLAVRKQIGRLSIEMSDRRRQMMAMIDAFTVRAEKVQEKLRRAEQAAQPKCKCCGQVVPQPRSRSRSRF